ncbi:IucA/IucC family siderophore biosynthesis protein [Bosea sp. LjRoot9]|uniref:IucA/IucC family protein n=1 Tax=Bosea sp. LjRoot9 TaxID=3342341 RepID=UPI003ECF31C4
MIETKPKTLELASRISARALLLSLMREWQGWSIGSGDGASATDSGSPRQVLKLPLAGREIHVALTHLSQVGAHGLRPPFYEIGPEGAMRVVPFPELLNLITAEPGIAGADSDVRGLVFLRRALDSLATIEDALRHPCVDDAVFAERDPGFVEAEQALRFGHNVHPTPRSRDQFTLEDTRRFSPEYGQGFALHWWSVSPGIVLQGSSRGQAASEMAASLAIDDPAMEPAIRRQVDEGRVLLPMHPWQASQLMLDPAITRLMTAGDIRALGPAGSNWHATSSLRSIHAPHAVWMLKMSLSLRLTNSQRIIEPYECERGLEIEKLLAGPVGQRIAARFPSIRVMGEPGYLALHDETGAPLRSTIVVFRDNPFSGDRQHSPAAVLAALCEIGPDGRSSALATTIERIASRQGSAPAATALAWFERFLHNIALPLLGIQADHGLLFGAHQQNIVVGLDDGWPVTLHFRDCQGTGYVREFLPELAAQAPDVRLEAGHVFDSAYAARLAGYYLIVNSVFSVIGALALAGLASEERLLAALRAALSALAAQPLRDRTCLDYLLTSPTLLSKGNFMICFRNINENTDVTDPLAGYVELPNPIAGARS